MMRDWDDAFANMAHIEGSDALPAQWAAEAAAYRANVQIETYRYGQTPREAFDLIRPDGTPKGLVIFIHGGYWMRLDKSDWTHLAAGARANGWAVCLPSYTLAPQARITQITAQIGAAINTAAAMIAGPIRLSGHSAGGHLATRMICGDTPVTKRITHTLSISGVHDLRPLLHTKLNNTLHLDLAEAVAESPALQMPNGKPHLTTWVGGNERPEFIRQSQLMTQMWEGLDAQTTCIIDENHNHFSILDGLRDSHSPITKALIGDP